MIEYLLWVYRVLFHCRRDVLNFFFADEEHEHTIRVHVNDIPWLGITGTTEDGTEHTVTDTINHSLEYGTHVTPKYLDFISGLTNVISWKYLDSAELEEKEFPSTGFLIEDASTKVNKTSNSEYTSKSN